MAVTVPSNGGGANAQQQAVQQNFALRQNLIRNGVDLTQSIFNQTVTNYVPGSPYVLTARVNNVGVLKRLWVQVTATVADGTSALGASLTQFGPANVLSQVVLTDTSNNVRVQTSGLGLHLQAAGRRRGPLGSAFVMSDPSGFGNILPVMRAANIPAGGTDGGVFSWFYEVPVSASDADLTGAIFMNTVSGVANLTMTINPAFFCAAGTTDNGASVYQMNTGSTAMGAITTFTVQVWQNCIDQIPTNQQGQFLLPPLDLQYACLFLNTSTSGFTANLDQAVQYANLREFRSTIVVYDNGGQYNPGTDINYLALQAANLTYYFKVTPQLLTLFARNAIGVDFPAGVYYFDHRAQPINTLQYGNRQLVINPSLCNANANFQIFYEAVAPLGVVSSAGSLPQN